MPFATLRPRRSFSLCGRLAGAGLGLALAAAAQAKTARLPQDFVDLGATMQSRVCGELLTGLALGGVQTLKAQQAPAPTLKSPETEAQRDKIYETGAQAVVLLTLSGSLSLPDRLKAGEVTQSIEKLAPEAHVATARYCVQRVAAWIRAGQVDKALMTQAYAQSRKLLDAALQAPLAGDPAP